MTLRGWIGYLKCMVVGHHHTTYRRGSGYQWHCHRCPYPHDYTLGDRIQILRDRWKRRWEKPSVSDSSDNDGIPF